MNTTPTPVRPKPAKLYTPELRTWVEAALPKTFVISMAGRIWALNAHGEVRAVKPPSLTAWHPPEADPPMAAPFDTTATIRLWDELRTPWEDYDLLHALEALMTLPQSVGRRRTGRGRGSARKSPFGVLSTKRVNGRRRVSSPGGVCTEPRLREAPNPTQSWLPDLHAAPTVAVAITSNQSKSNH